MEKELVQVSIGDDVDVTTSDGKLISGIIVRIKGNEIEIKASRKSRITIPKQEIKTIKKMEIKKFEVEEIPSNNEE